MFTLMKHHLLSGLLLIVIIAAATCTVHAQTGIGLSRHFYVSTVPPAFTAGKHIASTQRADHPASFNATPLLFPLTNVQDCEVDYNFRPLYSHQHGSLKHGLGLGLLITGSVVFAGAIGLLIASGNSTDPLEGEFVALGGITAGVIGLGLSIPGLILVVRHPREKHWW